MSDTAPIEHPTWLTTGDFTQADEPFGLFAHWLKEAVASEPRDPTAMTPRHRRRGWRCRTPGWCCSRAATTGDSFSTPTWRAKRGENWTARKKAGLGVPLEVAQPPDSHSRLCRTRDAGGGRRLFRHAAERRADRRLGQPAVAAARKPRRPSRRRSPTSRQNTASAPCRAHRYWIGYRVVPMKIEFWHDRPFRLHDRIEFVRDTIGGAWTKTRLYP